MLMLEYEPTFELLGVPLSWPVEVLNVAQLGMLVIENISVLPLGSVVVGVNWYFCPAVTLAAGEPEIVGEPEVALEVTLTENAAKEALLVPSLTEMPIFEYVPTFELLGVPLSWPVEVLKVSLLGMLVIEKVSVPPLGSVVVGVNVYFCP